MRFKRQLETEIAADSQLFTGHAMDHPERDKPAPTPDPLEDDDAELELEPPDETIEERQRQIALNAIRARIDIDDVYRDADRDRGGEIMEGWVRNFRFQFQLKHLLIATAVLAIILTLIKLELFGTTVIVGFMLTVGSLYAYLMFEQKKHDIETDRKRKEMYAKRRAQMAANMGAPLAEQLEANNEVAPAPTNRTDEIWQEAAKERSLHIQFQFSLRTMLIMMTSAAVMLTLVRILGGPAATASVLGLVAMGGLVVYACGYEPPQNMVLAWWLILVMYVLVSIGTAVWSAIA
jgi:hypothetical protein